jgi:ADP-ribosyl-[dinitrogen reductase] hydrolase
MSTFDKNKTLKDLVYGSLIGDAMGIQYEFYSKYQINIDDLNYNPSHFLNIEAGRWSDDGDNVLLVVKTMNENKTDLFDYKSYAKKLYNWVKNGTSELGDTTGIGCGNTIFNVVMSENFVNDPFSMSEKIYNKTKSASNGAIMKILPISIYYSDIDAMITNTILLCKTTHANNIVIGCCIAINLLCYWASREKNNYYDLMNVRMLIDRVFDKLNQINLSYQLNLSVENLSLIKKYMYVTDIEFLKLDEEFKMGHVLKTMGSAFWAFHNTTYGYSMILKKIYAEGGDTDTNGCVVGGLIASIYGMENIPEAWITKLKHKDFIESILQEKL